MSMTTPMPHGYVPGAGPRNATHRPLLRRWLVAGGLLLLFLIGGAVLAAALGMTLGAQVAILAALIAVIPLAVVVPAFLWLDRHEAEPPSSLVVAFAWGALVATSISLVINTLAASVAAGLGVDPQFFAAVMVAPVVEEIAKGVGILVIWAMRRREFDGVLDGIVYAGIIAAGFAFGENILYLGQAMLEGGAVGLAVTFVLRGIVSPFAHPLFTLWTGVGIGMLVTGRSPLRFVAPLLGLVLAMVLHAMWNGGTALGFEGWVGAYLFVHVPVFLATIAFAVWSRRREDRTAGANLRHYERLGVFHPAEISMLSDSRLRRAARDRAAQVGGRPAKAAMRDFQDDAIELAYLRGRSLRGHAGPDVVAEEHRLVDSVVRARAALTAR